MSRLGFRRFEDMIGRVDLIEASPAVDHWKARGLDLAPLLMVPEVDVAGGAPAQHAAGRRPRRHARQRAAGALRRRARRAARPSACGIPVRNVHRCVGAMLSGEIARRHGAARASRTAPSTSSSTAPPGSRSAPGWRAGSRSRSRGEANDYVGKGLSGGRLVIMPPATPHAARRGEHHHRQRRAVRRHLRRGLHSRRRRRALLRCATPGPSRWSRASATTAAST